MSNPLALYIHWPFCASKCPYCDFNAHVREALDFDAWTNAYLADLQHWHQATQGRRLSSIFFGGGTPSLMPPATAQAIIDHARALWGLSDRCEITLEANPTSSDYQKFQAFRDAGVNRLSIGIQSLHDDALKTLGRNHNAAEGLNAITMARDIYDRFSFDLIYARPEQSAQAWREELEHAITLSRGHLSLYQLTIEPGTQFKTLHDTGRLLIPADDEAAHLYQMTHDICAAHGLDNYEISNYGQAGHQSAHNMTYWTGGDYLGIGPGAHGRITDQDGRLATVAHHAPEIWLQRVTDHGTGVNRETLLSTHEQAIERLMLGLRIERGVHRGEVAQCINPAFLQKLYDEGLMHRSETHLRVTMKGRLLINGIVAGLIKG